ncbi:AraC family transcriptional regulator [bacterium 1xD42-62]|uniref:AraC family transcriptional regulator n=2 Tax=Parablautia muri TaxID=2320879 RepID=A0A9X5BHD1_9FIRM|nr:AraC family transcriptional regulator [Parablautia muri]
MRREKRYQTKHKMFVSYVIVPVGILLVFSSLFSFVYYKISRDSVLAFENSICETADNELKNIMDNLLKSSAQYAMTPWVMRLKYMQKTPQLMEENITASDISDYAGMLSLTEINDNMIESIYIYYSLGEFGISSYGKTGWQRYIDLNHVQCQEEEFMSGVMLSRNNQKVIFHDVSLLKNGRRIKGFFLVQTIPLGNIYSGEVNILFFVPYESIYAYIDNFTDEGTRYLYLTDGDKIIYTDSQEEQILPVGENIERFKSGEKNYFYSGELRHYVAEYTKVGMEIGIVQVLGNDFLYRDFILFVEWILAGCLILLGLILLVAFRMTKYSYQPLERIMDMLREEDYGEEINEYQIIEKALEELDSQKKRLEVTVFEQNPLIEQYILHALLNSNKPQANEVKYVNTIRQYLLYRALVLKNRHEARQYIREIDSCLAIYPQVHAAFLEENNYYIWILSYGDESLVEEISEILSQTFSESGYEDAALGMSKAHEDILHLLSAYNQAVRALEYSFFYPEKKIISMDENHIEEREQNCRAFEIDKKRMEEMKQAVLEMDAEKFVKQYQEMLAYNFHKLGLNKEAYLIGIRRLNNSIPDLFESGNKASATEQMELLNPENYGSIKSYLQTFKMKAEALMQRCSVKENPIYYARNEIIRNYVKEHLTDANLSLNETAKLMHYTPTYFGKYFKEQFGCTFQKYVASGRIECAKKYLLKGNMSVQEIALKCGFTNDVTFRRTFKMYVGVTPSQFEKENIM